ncbi:hypothetical protein [Novosphingobium olei]|uniref:hypothetical protein n=1 Tax=Novosphingobium olei TaxID=2728851 RepID=UPI00308D7575|nr:hypothetical protein NSDW_32870 [Novosphingobium olei]
MKTSFDSWLSALAEGRKGGDALGDDVIPQGVRGLPWGMVIALPGNWAGSTLVASISVAVDAATPIATPSVSGPSYDSVNDYTTWTLAIADTTVFPADAVGEGVQSFPMMIKFTPAGGTQMALIGGAFTVLAKA